MVILTILFYTQSVSAQNMWMWNQRTHPELKWETLETEHFNIHYHQGIEAIAERGALIAEQTYQPIMDQLQIEDFGKTDIVFSAEDEIMNGFAMPSNQIFIWVSQNDVAGHFGGSDKWLKMVITHEFQHIVQFQAHRTWAGIFGGISLPMWWIEGMAEYMTEVWRVGRSDSRMKIHTYRNTMNQLDAHDDGYAKVLYLAWKYGDSTLVNISKHRLYLHEDQYPYWYDFERAFKAATGQTVQAFDEEWRRVMNTYYYGYKAQKEMPDEIGEPLPLPGYTRVRSANISPNSAFIAIVGRRDKRMRDYGLYIQQTDSSRDFQEIHFGRINGNIVWSPDSREVIFSEYHRGKHGSLLNDLRIINIETNQKRWLTNSFRALHPVFSHEGEGVFFAAHPGETTQIFYQDIQSGKRIQISQFEGDVQIQDLDLSPDGKQLVFMMQDVDGAVDIAIMNIDGTAFQKITDDAEEDVFPVWTSDGSAVVYTSYRNSTPNLYRIDLDSLKITQMTDVAEGIYSKQRFPGSNRIIATTLADIDTVRIRAVRDDRVAPELGLNIRDPFQGWRTKSPDIPIQQMNYSQGLEVEDRHPYESLQSIRPLFKFIFPLDNGLFLLAAAEDALGKHIFQGGGVVPWDGSSPGLYFSYSNFQFLPVIHLIGMQDMALQYSTTPTHSFLEQRDVFELVFNHPMNTGEALSSNHLIQAELEFSQRDIIVMDDIAVTTVSPKQEFNASATYTWKSQRPRSDNYSLPRDGLGFQAHLEKATSKVWGENDYSQYWMDGFFNFDIPKLPFMLYGRMKYVGQSGNIQMQDELGFSESAPFYFSTEYMHLLKNTGVIAAPESYSLRGQVGQFQANELIYSVTELRFPVIETLPMDVFGIGVRNVTSALFYDFGFIPDSETDLATLGFELKFDVCVQELPLVTLAWGLGGDSAFWRGTDDQKNKDILTKSYLRMALVNPF